MAFYGLFQRLTQLSFVGNVVLNGVVIEPVALVVRADLTVLAPQVAARRELFNGAANWYQGFHFRGDIEVAVLIVPHVKRDNTEVVTANQVRIFFAVVQGKGKHPLQVVEEFRSFLLIQRQNDFAVRAGLEGVTVAVLSTQRLMVVDFTVDGQRVGFFLVIQRLGARVDVDNRQTFMGQDGLVAGIDTGPVRAAMAHQTREFQCFFTQLARVSFDIQYAKN